MDMPVWQYWQIHHFFTELSENLITFIRFNFLCSLLFTLFVGEHQVLSMDFMKKWLRLVFSSVSNVSSTYQRSLPAGLCVHTLNPNRTLPWISFCVVSLAEVLQDTRSKACWTETTQNLRILYSSHRCFTLELSHCHHPVFFFCVLTYTCLLTLLLFRCVLSVVLSGTWQDGLLMNSCLR